MNLPDQFELLGDHITIELPGARAVFTTRRGGHSSGPYESLNLGLLTDDDPRLVRRNRVVLESIVGVRMAFVRQVHGPGVVTVTAPAEPPPEADGHASGSRAVAPTVLTADCLPVALAADGAVAMLHAGWRGLAAGVIKEGVRALREAGGSGPMHAAIGPGAGPCCYEVGEEVLEVFDEAGPNLDLKAIARAQLVEASAEVVHDVGLCTLCSDPGLFFSHRRDRGVTGRQAGTVWLT